MKTAKIEVSLHGHSFKTSFQFDGPEYLIADEAYRLALIFANTRVIAEYGHPISGHEFGKLLEDMEYEYTISEGRE